MSIQDGWMNDVAHVPTGWVQLGAPDVFDGQMWPKQIVHHVMQGYQSTMNTWANERPPRTKVAVHFTINRTGRIVQHMPIWNPGWHVGWQSWNLHSVGIEHEGFSVDPVVYGYDYLYSAARPWPQAMVDASVRVTKWVMEAIHYYDTSVVPGPDTIIGHSETGQPDRVDDPGLLWVQTVKPQLLAAFTSQETIDEAYRRGWRDGRNTALDEVLAAIGAIPRG